MTQDIPIEQNMVINLLMKIDSSIVGFIKIFISLNLCLTLYAIFFQDMLWLLNIQVAFFSSLFISVASFFSYKKNVQNRLENIDSSIILNEDRDEIEKIDDPYDLYSEYKEVAEDELSSHKIKEIINEEKSRLKRNFFKNTLFSMGGFLSIYRILGYICLIFGFFALSNNAIFIPIAFIIGLSIVPIGVLLSKLIKAKE